jgi:uncharacterized protein (UPF0261 family)
LWPYTEKLAERKLLIQDAMRVQARTSLEEVHTIAQAVADKLNKQEDKKLLKFVIPIQGFSSISVKGGALYDPDLDRALIDELKKNLDPEIEIIEVDTHINTPEFAKSVVEALKQIL